MHNLKPFSFNLDRLETMEKNAYDKMKQLLKWNAANIKKKMVTKEESSGPRCVQCMHHT
jgi:hypothetical protein